MTRIIDMRVLDLRFPTSQHLDGSDAMNPDPDYSAAYVILKTDTAGIEGHGLTFTIGRGNEICCAAIEAMRHLVVGLEMDKVAADMGAFWRHVTSDSQLRWIGPDKGAIHLATGAVVNAVWDIWAKMVGKPVWKLVADMSPEELVRCIDFRYITDCITPEEALAMLREKEPGKAERIATLEREGYPCYTTSAGWLGYGDEKLRRLCQEAVDAGFNHVKLKVGRDKADDIRRLRIAREVLGPDRQLMIDANQVWEVGQAIDWVHDLAFAKPWFIEEPTNPDDVEGHRKIREGVAPVQVATGEMCQNRIMFKQFIMRGAIDVVQIDSCRLGGVNEILAVLLMAAKYNLLVCPHAGGVGLCEYVQHLSMIDYVSIAGTREGRVVEYVDHLHEHFKEPCVVQHAAYMPPSAPGFSIEMKPATLEDFQFRG
ncbi:L-fuconate dehydratase [Aminobacter sp. NyZ550]|jgi:L-fuconate dehydratase|uniref:L-fuconate dehydratase n=1 Tax=Aminobacter aminovorans TaxID=83263 RepID=A0AAC9AQ49_AMIAI|nr:MULTISPECIES: L-fuconate dehydratase [Aminobacter]AMS39842.1 fuconate dehydratase [Aminobacter aminovorans]MBB3707130.1 L-fuconate dehydratase [Aminobacter aminovorans]WAX96101.1 L-fuconate dehydratase [Aminobacter sp. NyZ550]WMC96869.1 L-fuconate dehydratase [Aminobacter aminovorans]